MADETTPFVVCYTGEHPPAAVCDRAAAAGIFLTPLLGDLAGERTEDVAARRLSQLRPRGYVINYPHGPYLSAALVDAAECLGIVSFMGPSLALEDHVRFMDVDYLLERGVLLTAAPGCTTISVAEGTLALLLAVNLGLVMANQACKAGLIWQRTRPTLCGASLGIVGMGNIGQRVARLAHALGMRILYSSRTRHWQIEDDLGAQYVDLPTLFEQSDYVSIHSTAALTQGLIGRELLSRARGVALINTADATIVDPDALLEALDRGWIRIAAFDDRYPPPHQARFDALGDDRFLVLPFISWDTPHYRERGWELCLESQLAFKEARPVPYQLVRPSSPEAR